MSVCHIYSNIYHTPHVLLGFLDPDLIVVREGPIAVIAGPSVTVRVSGGFPSLDQSVVQSLSVVATSCDARSAVIGPFI